MKRIALASAAALCALAAAGAPADRSSRAARPSASSAARFAPAAADAVLLLAGADALAGVRGFFETAGQLAPALDPKELSRLVRPRIGVDVLAPAGETAPWGIGPGPRAVVLRGASIGLTAPLALRRATAARKAAAEWIGDAGKLRRLATIGRAAGKGRDMRAGAVAPIQGGQRLLLAM